MRQVATALLILLAAVAAHGATVRLQEAAGVEGRKVTLGDVAIIETTSPRERARLASVVVDYLPSRCTAKLIESHAIEEALAGAGVDLSRVRVAGATSITVTSALAGGNPTSLLDAAANYLAVVAPEGRWEVLDMELDFDAPQGFQPVVTAVLPAAAAGPVRFDVADVKAPLEKLGHAFANLTRSAGVVVAKRRLFAGRKLSADDVEIKYMPVEMTVDALGEAGDILGCRLLRGFKAGEVLRLDGVEGQPVINRGDTINLMVAGGGMTLSIKTVALERGAVGDVVRLKRTRDRRVYLAKVTGPGKAVPFDGGGR